MAWADPRDRRKYTRLTLEELVSFTPFAGRPSLGQGRDVSLGGICFTTVGCPVSDGELMRVSFNVEDETVEAIGRVAWTKPLDDITLEIGLEFVRIDPWAARLLEEKQAEARD